MFTANPSRLDSPLPRGRTAVGADDLQQLRREFPGDGLREVIEMFREEGEQLLEQMAGALARLDGHALRRAVHALRGAGANFGAWPLSALCQEIEVTVRGGNLAAAAPLLREVRAEYHRVESALEKECPPSPLP